MPCSAAGLRQIDTAEKQHEFFAKQPRRTFAGEAISERQSMAIVKQPRRTFAGERQAEAFIAPAKPAPDENIIRVDPDLR